MTKILVDKAVIDRALEALVVAEEFVDRHSEDWYISVQKDLKHIRETITALRKTLAEPHKQSCACEVCRGCDNADIKAEQGDRSEPA